MAKMKSIVRLLFFSLWFVSNLSFARVLSPRVISVIPVIPESVEESFRIDSYLEPLIRSKKSDLGVALGLQTPVKDQWYRNTCSIFSATAALESLIAYHYEEFLDLSENYLEFAVMDPQASKIEDGSETSYNIPILRKKGTILEADWPYEPYDWRDKELPDASKVLAERRCSGLIGKSLAFCLITHLPPGDRRFKNLARSVRSDYGLSSLRYRSMNRQKQIKRAIDTREAVILGVEYYYGAWNDLYMEKLGIGTADVKKWARGIVETPTLQDIKLSKKEPTSHSVLVVGYDDEEQVYFFKNSWGTSDFGRETFLVGGHDSAGYGKISYGYAHNHGTFYRVFLE